MVNLERDVDIAKKIITEEIEKAGFKVVKVILFGSRVRGDYDKDSDWDFFVIIDNEISILLKRKTNSKIRRRLAELKIPIDIFIQSESTVNSRRNNVGYLTYYVMKEGVEL